MKKLFSAKSQGLIGLTLESLKSFERKMFFDNLKANNILLHIFQFHYELIFKVL